MRTVTHAEFMAELRAQGVPREHMAVVCPACAKVQSPTSLIRAGAGADFEAVNRLIGFSCVGRWRQPRLGPSEAKALGEGCNWTLGGFFQIERIMIITDDGKEWPAFEPATAEQAQTLRAAHQGAEIVDVVADN